MLLRDFHPTHQRFNDPRTEFKSPLLLNLMNQLIQVINAPHLYQPQNGRQTSVAP